jgi:hypothetical protein
MMAAAARFKEAWDTAKRRSDTGAVLSDRRDIVEMHEAALGLIWATGTNDLQGALDVFHRYEAEA